MNSNPSAPIEIETVKQCVGALYDENGGTKNAMLTIGVNKTRARAFASAEVKDEISFARVVQLTSRTATAAAKFLARRAGGVFCSIPEHPAADALAMTSKAVRDQGEAIAEVLTAHQQKKLTRHKAEKAVKDLDKAICDMAALRQSILASIEPGE